MQIPLAIRSISSVLRNHDEQASRPIGQWAELLSIPSRTLIHHGAKGEILLFAIPTVDAEYYSVHEDFLGNTTPLPFEAQPISMPEKGVMGVVLAGPDCARLEAGRPIEAKFFPALIRKHVTWGNVILPVKGRLGCGLRPDGWRIAVYMKIAKSEWSVHSPTSLRITSAYCRDVDVEAFLERVKSHEFISDIFINGSISTERPEYVSGKLSELIDANALFWREYDVADTKERERRRRGVLEYLSEDFLQLCDKTSNSKSLLAFAAQVSDPTLVPASQRLLETSVTPAMLSLLTAAKLYWSGTWGDSPPRDAYPERGSIVEFLRFLGLRETNAASSGATLIRPESVRIPAPAPDLQTRLMRRSQGLRR